jgi:hypothetical protein
MTIQLCAITRNGDFINHFLPDLDSAAHFGNSSVNLGDWCTWDAFDLLQRCTTGRKLVASYGSESGEAAS